jgi:Spy/CpxP family protein refolding chaperone
MRQLVTSLIVLAAIVGAPVAGQAQLSTTQTERDPAVALYALSHDFDHTKTPEIQRALNLTPGQLAELQALAQQDSKAEQEEKDDQYRAQVIQPDGSLVDERKWKTAEEFNAEVDRRISTDSDQIQTILTPAQLTKLYSWNNAEVQHRRDEADVMTAPNPPKGANMNFYQYWKDKLNGQSALVIPGPRGPDYPEEGIVKYFGSPTPQPTP